MQRCGTFYRMLPVSRSSSAQSSAVNSLVPPQDAEASHAAHEPPVPAHALPSHVAVIMDGNRRWARTRGLPSFHGHKAGVAALRTMTRCCRQWGIPALTAFALSTENWKRENHEVQFLLKLIEQVVSEEASKLVEAGVKLKFVGDHSVLSPSLVATLAQAEDQTSGGTKMCLTIALSYGGRQDIARAFQQACVDVAEGRLNPSEISVQSLSEQLSLGHLPSQHRDADLLIRTSGEQRLSNFLLWEAAYAELYFSRVLWPDFGEQEFSEALQAYALRDRRYGRF
jgi:undecaprenyl diphosphate synthase